MHRRLDNHQTGFTLLEGLIAIVIISIGLLGLIGLQTASLNNTEVAAAASQASIAAESMADRMRANMAGVQAGDYDGLATDSIGQSPNCQNNTCTQQQVAAYDLSQWKAVLAESLPNPVGSIKQIDANHSKPPYRFRITISWHAHHANGYQPPASHSAARCSKTVHCLTRRVTL